MARPKVNKSAKEVSQKIDLEKTFGIDFKGRRALREAIGEAILEKIRDRTEKGKAIGGKAKLPAFKGTKGSPAKGKYSARYVDSDEFKSFGKNQNELNMTLTGDMLGLMDIIKQTGNSITLGWDDSTENAKAFNHVTGDTVPRRRFFGVTNDELKEVKREFKDEIRQAIKVQEDEGRKAFEAFALKLIDDIKDDADGQS